MNLLDPGRVVAIRKLLDTGQLSQRGVAREVGADRSTVAAVAADAHPSERLRRCPGCGGMVQGECKLCGLRARLRKRRFQPVDRPGDGDLGLTLHGGARKRYLQLIWAKIAAGEPMSEDAA
jgi:hypothetical protein